MHMKVEGVCSMCVWGYVSNGDKARQAVLCTISACEIVGMTCD